MWRTAATSPGTNRFDFAHNPLSRKTDEVHARQTVSMKEAVEHAEAAARFASALRAAIALGNGQEREIEVPSELFD
jgi:hypothetical protein